MRKVIFGVCLLFLSYGVFWAQQAEQPQQGAPPAQPSAEGQAAPAVPLEFVISPAQKARKNPEAFNQESVDKGKSVYETQCAMCHGKTGNGKGDLAGVMHLKLSDFTKPATLEKRTDGELFAMINSGLGAMPAQAKRMKPKTVWDVVNFLRMLEGKVPSKSPAKK